MDFQLARSNMVLQQVRPWHVLNNKVLTTLSQIPRENFVPPAYAKLAYSDLDVPLEEGQIMLPPKTVGRALAALELTGTEKVLEIGTGSGYVTACLGKLAKSVVSIEICASLLSQAEKHLSALNYRNLNLIQGNAVFGWEALAPFDVILVTGCYPLGVPQKLLSQLKAGGRIFAFCGQGPMIEATLTQSSKTGGYETISLFETKVPPLLHTPCPPVFNF